MRLLVQAPLAFAVVCAAFAQPVIRPGSVVNAASYIPRGLPNHGIAQGGMFILKGLGLGARGVAVASSFPLQPNMGGTSMRITVAGTAVNALMIYVVGGQVFEPGGPFDQLAGIVPSNTPTGDGTITVTYMGQTSPPVAITIVRSAFGIFTINQAGFGPGVVTTTDFQVRTLVAAARPADSLFIWGTGLGPIQSSDAGAPPVGDLDVPVEVYVGNERADVSYRGRSGCCAGIDQILFTVPPGVEGCFVPLVVKSGNMISNSVTLSITPGGAVCSDPAGFTAAELQNARGAMAIADIGLTRLSGAIQLPGVGALRGAVDIGAVDFRRYQPGNVLGLPRGGVAAFEGRPSTGCLVFPFAADPELFENLAFENELPLPGQQGLDAGAAIEITGPAGVRRFVRQGSQQTGFFYDPPDDFLGGGFPPLIPPTPDFLTPGRFTADNGAGSSGVGPFAASLNIPDTSIVWTNQAATDVIPRSQDLTITWTGPGSGLVMIEGSSANPATGAAAGFHCVAPSGAGTFTAPSWVLSALPASGLATDIPAPAGFLLVGETLASPARFQAAGLDAGYFNWRRLEVKLVEYR
jgi:uncharacterized protein (TIGR03437 family)